MKKSATAADSSWTDTIRIRPDHIVRFTRQLATLYAAGVPLHRGVASIAAHAEDSDLGLVVGVLAAYLGKGLSLAQAMSLFPRAFSHLYVSMVRVGEHSSRMDTILNRLADWMERDAALKQRVRAALTYPAFVVGLAATLTLALLCTVVPRFESIYDDIAISLPLVTRGLLGLSAVVRNPWYCLAATAVVLIAILGLRAWLASSAGRRQLDRFLFRLPLVGTFLRDVAVARFAGALATMLSSGVDMLTSVRLAAAASGCALIDEDGVAILKAIYRGASLSSHVHRRKDLYPSGMAHMLRVGEESGTLPRMLESVVYVLSLNAEHRLEVMMTALEPVLLAGIACVIGGIMVAVFLPLYQILGKISG